MKLFGYSPIAYFNRWFAEPIRVTGEETVQRVLDALNRHPLAQDETAQDYIVPAARYPAVFEYSERIKTAGTVSFIPVRKHALTQLYTSRPCCI